MINKTIQKGKEYVKTIIYGRQNYPPQMRRLLAQYGDTPINSLAVSRSPLPGLMNTVLDKFSMGLYYNRIMNSPYDELFHLRLELTLEDGNIAMIEKNEVLTMLMNPPLNKGAQNFDLPFDELPQGLTVNSILQNAHNIQGDKFFKYSAISNNCQDFVLACLNGSKIYNKQLQLFVKQNVTGLFGDLVSLRKGVNTITDIAAKANELIYGSGIQLVIGYKDKTIYKKYNKMNSIKDEKKIVDKMHKLAEEVHKHQSMHGGKINIAHAFKNLGHSVEHGFNQAQHYVTAPKGGLASALVHKGIPIVTGAIGSTIAEGLVPEGGPVSGFVGNQAGKYVGNQIANKIGQKTGTGIIKGSQEAKDKMARIRAMKKK